MEKAELLGKAKETLTPLETDNIVAFIKQMSFQTFVDHPWLIVLFGVVFFYAAIRRSKPLLLFLFTFFSILLLVRYTMPVDAELSVGSLLPMAGGGLFIGGVIIYFAFIKSE